MKSPDTHLVADPRERAVLFGPVFQDSPVRDESILDELSRLCDTAGGIEVARMVQLIHTPNPAFYLGTGKVEALAELVKISDADIAVFDLELSPAQGRNLEKALGVRVLDRSELILDIFASRAKTGQACMQVELAQLKYKLPRLKRMWSHLDRISAAIGARGPGEKQIESDRRLIKERINDIEKKLDEVSLRRHRVIGTRTDFKVCLVGYTNAGKSTLLKALTGAGTYVADQLFATLDTLSRKLKISGVGQVVLSDTVGFVNHLPHHLVNSFHATLSEVTEADLLLHVVDASDPNIEIQRETVDTVLKSLDCGDIPTIVVANKMDLQGAVAGAFALNQHYEQVVEVSAVKGQGLENLLNIIAEDMTQNWETLCVLLPYTEGSVIQCLSHRCQIEKEEAREEGMYYELQVGKAVADELGLYRFDVNAGLNKAEDYR